MLKNKIQTQRKAIVLNRMYAGDYLSSNLGHEVINLYRADNNQHYLYLNATGDFKKEHISAIGYMILTMYHSKGVMEVLGYAIIDEDVFQEDDKENDRHQLNYIEENSIKYGGIRLNEIFRGDKQQNIFITFHASKVILADPSKRICIYNGACENPEGLKESFKYLIRVARNLANTKQYQLFYPNEPGNGKDKQSGEKEDHRQLLNNLIQKKEIWGSAPVAVSEKICLKEYVPRNLSLFDICRLQNYELAFSNALFYFMQHSSYRELWISFFKQDKYNIELSNNFTVTREQNATIPKEKNGLGKSNNVKNDTEEGPKGNDEKGTKRTGSIDLCIIDKNMDSKIDKVIIIENKIKSNINKSSTDPKGSDQLVRYWKYVIWFEEGLSKKKNGNKKPEESIAEKVIKKGFVLHPNYRHVNLNNEGYPNGAYTEITYKDLYDYFNSYERKIQVQAYPEHDLFFALIEAMERHTFSTFSEYMKHETEEKFYSRIKIAINEQ